MIRKRVLAMSIVGLILTPMVSIDAAIFDSGTTTSKTLAEYSNNNYSARQTMKFKVPKGVSINNVKTDNGDILGTSYDKDTQMITVDVGNGTSGKLYNNKKYSKQVTDSVISSSNSFSSTYAYNSGGYTGTLDKKGSSFVDSGSYTPSDTKSFTTTRRGSSSSFDSSVYETSGAFGGYISKSGSATVVSGQAPKSYTAEKARTRVSGACTIKVWSRWNGTSWVKDRESTVYSSSYYSYSNKGYKDESGGDNQDSWTQETTPSNPSVGTTYLSYHAKYTATMVLYEDKYTPDTRVWEQKYSGTLKKPSVDTRKWRQNYSGTAYSGGDDTIYNYTVTVDYNEDILDISVVPSTKEWTNKDITLTTNSNSNFYRGIKSTSSSLSAKEFTSRPVDYNISTNGNYVFEVADTIGNTNTGSYNVKNIDKVKPTAVIKSSTTSPTNKDIVLTISASDNASGVVSIQKPDGTIVKSADTVYRVTENGNYEFIVTDKAGNEATILHSVTNIHRAKPTATITADKTAWTNTNVILTIKAKSSAGIATIMKPDGSVASSDTTTYTVTTNGDYKFKVVDKAGNEDTFSYEVTNIDKVLPLYSGVLSPLGWTNGDVKWSIQASDNESGFSRMKLPDGSIVYSANTDYYCKSNGKYTVSIYDKAGNVKVATETVGNIDKVKPGITLTPSTTTWTSSDITITAKATDDLSGVNHISLPDGTVVNGSTAIYVVQYNGTYEFKVTDNAGNERTEVIVISNIDKENPTLELSQNPTDWTNKNVVITAVGKDASSSVDRIGKPDGTVANGDTTTYTVSSNGVYQFYALDKVNHRFDTSINIGNIDKMKPTIKLTQSTVEPTNKPIVISYKALDDLSGVKRVKLPSGKYIDGDVGEFSVTSNGTYTFEVYDNAGNINSETIKITNYDDTIPVIKVVANPTDWTNKDVKLTATATDNVAVRRIRQVGDEPWINDNKMNLIVGENGVYRFEAEDTAGNIGYGEIKVTNIDKILPSGTFTPHEVPWTNNLEPITTTFKPSDEGGSLLKHWRYRTSCTNLDDDSITKSDWSSYIMGETSKDITLTTEGQWSIESEVTDNVGNMAIVTSGLYQLGYELKLLDYRIANIVKPPAEYVYPIGITGMPVEVKSGYNVTFRINVMGRADKLSVKFYDEDILKGKKVDMIKLEDITNNSSVWQCEFATDLKLPLNTIVYSKVVGERGSRTVDYNITNNWVGQTLKIVGSALDDTEIQRVY